MAEPSEPTRPTAEGRGGETSAGSESEGLSFEAALRRLEEIVDQLEEGDLELEAALSAFERGVALSRRCAEQLARADRRIEVLIRESESWQTQPFEPDEDAAEENS
jgi:exodeoxyribonuclease VII small subunit